VHLTRDIENDHLGYTQVTQVLGIEVVCQEAGAGSRHELNSIDPVAVVARGGGQCLVLLIEHAACPLALPLGALMLQAIKGFADEVASTQPDAN
jgi:hypothetical protein